MATIKVQFDDSLVKSVTFAGYGKKDHTSSSFTFTSPLSFTGAEVYGNWSGKIYWDPTSSHSDPTLVANVNNGVVSMNSSYTVSVKNRTIYIYGEKSSSSSVLQVSSAGWDSNILHSVNLTDGTFSLSNNAINFTRTQYIESLYITNNALQNYWDGKIYWKNESGSKFLVASVNYGSVSMNPGIEPITYSGRSRTISFVAEGQYFHRVRYFKNNGTWNSGGDPYIDYVVDGGYSYTSGPSNNISRPGYRLLGWSTSSTATSAAFGTNDSIGEISADVNVWAVWIKDTVTITLDANGGVFQDNQESIRSIPNQVIGTQFYFGNYSGLVARTNYKLLGWSANKDSTSPTYTTDGYVDVGGSNATYYAVWQKTVAKIILHGNGGVWGGNLPTRTVSKNVGDTLSFADYGPNGSPPLLRTYHTLSGWSTSATGSASWDANGHVTVGATDADYYAVWRRHIDPFYWDGRNGTTDSSIIASGLPVSNITAERWNRLKAKVKEISEATGGSYTYSNVSSGSLITAAEYTVVRNAISKVKSHGTLPPSKSAGDKIMASLFNGTQSLKSAVNTAIISYNNS